MLGGCAYLSICYIINVFILVRFHQYILFIYLICIFYLRILKINNIKNRKFFVKKSKKPSLVFLCLKKSFLFANVHAKLKNKLIELLIKQDFHCGDFLIKNRSFLLMFLLKIKF